MNHFWIVTIFHFRPQDAELTELEASALNDYGSMGVEEFSLSEAEVDVILGDRSYSGGDLSPEVLDEVEENVLGKPGNFRFFFGDAGSAKAFHESVQKKILCESQLEQVPQEDWNAEWKKHYSPILVNGELEIVPSWQQDHQARASRRISIYPGMGFGTGSHETTFLCLKLFTEEAMDERTEKVLDFGSGSGILGLSSLLFHPEAKVDFYDIDPEANENCYQNAELNGLSGRAFRLLLPEVRDFLHPSYDLVFANILESVLLLEKDALIGHTGPGGRLILSGLLRHQVDGIITSYSASGMKLVRREEKGDWGALLFERDN